MTTVGGKSVKKVCIENNTNKGINLHFFRIKYRGEATLRPPDPLPSFSSSVYLLAESQIRICISELFPDVTTFVLLYLGRKSIPGNSNLALDVIN